MPVQATCLIMCPFCKALFRSPRTTCYQCGESLVPSDEIHGKTAGSSWGAYNKDMLDEIRRSRRIPVSIDASTIAADGSVGEPVIIEDVGKGGLQFRSTTEYPVGTRVRLLVNFNGEQLVASGTVRRISRALASGPYTCGIEFLHADPGLMEYINKLGRD